MFRRNRKARNSFRPTVDGLEAKQLLSGVPGTVLIGPGRPADVVPISVQSSGQYAIDFHGQQTSLSTKETIHLSIPGVLEQDITPPTTLSDVQSQSVSLQAGTAYNLTISPVGPSGAYALIQNVQVVQTGPVTPHATINNDWVFSGAANFWNPNDPTTGIELSQGYHWNDYEQDSNGNWTVTDTGPLPGQASETFTVSASGNYVLTVDYDSSWGYPTANPPTGPTPLGVSAPNGENVSDNGGHLLISMNNLVAGKVYTLSFSTSEAYNWSVAGWVAVESIKVTPA